MPDLHSSSLAQALLRPVALVDCSVVELVGTTFDQIFTILGLVLVPLEGPDLLLGCSSRLVGVVWHLSQLLGVDQTVALAVVSTVVGHATAVLARTR